MAAWLEKIIAERKLFLPGHSACPGCGPAVNMHPFLGALAETQPELTEIVLVIPASCWTIIAGVWPWTSFAVTAYLTPFASAAAEASGIRAALDLLDQRNAHVVVWAGDGSTCDIGLSAVSGAAERNENIIYVLNDNEAYMNTGVQKSGATPEGAWTTTTPLSAPKRGVKKDIDRIMIAHGIPYLATAVAGSAPMYRDLRAKVAKAAGISGFRFLHLLGACPPGWKFPASQTVQIARLAVESRYFPLYEYERGAWRITWRPKKPAPVGEFLKTQGRFAHLTDEEIALAQERIDGRWDELLALERQS